MAPRYTQASPLFSLLWQSALEFSVSFTGHLKRVERSTSRWRPFHSLSSECEINDELQGMAGDGEGAYTAASNYLRTPTSGLACHFTLPPSVSVLVQDIKNWARRRGLWRAKASRQVFPMSPKSNMWTIWVETGYLWNIPFSGWRGVQGAVSDVAAYVTPFRLQKRFNTNYWVPSLLTCAS